MCLELRSVRVILPEVIKEGRSTTGQGKETKFYSKCNRWSLEGFEQESNMVLSTLLEEPKGEWIMR